MTDILVLGVGNPLRRDDGVGPAVVAALSGQLAGVDLSTCRGEGTALMQAWAGYASVILIDAIKAGTPPGTVSLFEASETPLPKAPFRHSSHLFGVAEAVETARALGDLPKQLWIVGVEAEDFGYGEGLSAPVAAAVPAAVQAIKEFLKEAR